MRSCCIHLSAISLAMLKIFIIAMSLKIINLRWQLHLSVANDLKYTTHSNEVQAGKPWKEMNWFVSRDQWGSWLLLWTVELYVSTRMLIYEPWTGRYLGQGQVITFHSMLCNAISYPCLRYMLLATYLLIWCMTRWWRKRCSTWNQTQWSWPPEVSRNGCHKINPSFTTRGKDLPWGSIHNH